MIGFNDICLSCCGVAERKEMFDDDDGDDKEEGCFICRERIDNLSQWVNVYEEGSAVCSICGLGGEIYEEKQ